MDRETLSVKPIAFGGKVRSVFGYFFLILTLLLFIEAGPENDNLTIAPFFLILALLLIFSGAKAKRRIKRIHRYTALLSSGNIYSIQNLADATAQSADFVRKDMEKMIRKGYFDNISVNDHTDEILFRNCTRTSSDHPAAQPLSNEVITVTCAGCGAENSRPAGALGNCDYCGSPLM